MDDVIDQPPPRTYTMEDPAWVCFHCGERCTTVEQARLHFGSEPNCEPACRIPGGDTMRLLRNFRSSEDAFAASIEKYKRDLCVNAFEKAWEQAVDHEDAEYANGVITRRIITPAKLKSITVHTALGPVHVTLPISGDIRWSASVKLLRAGLIPYGPLTDRDLEMIFGFDVYGINLGQRVDQLIADLRKKK